MKKKLMITFAALFLAMTPAMSQIFIVSEEEWNNTRSQSSEGLGAIVAQQDVAWDQFVPMGSGMLILGCLGGAYLLGKRKTRKDK